jgi:hypothetical protein
MNLFKCWLLATVIIFVFWTVWVFIAILIEDSEIKKLKHEIHLLKENKK